MIVELLYRKNSIFRLRRIWGKKTSWILWRVINVFIMTLSVIHKKTQYFFFYLKLITCKSYAQIYKQGYSQVEAKNARQGKVRIGIGIGW